MFLADYHMHTYPFSSDAETSMSKMAEAAIENGLTHICITNHIDNCVRSPICPHIQKYFDEWEALEAAYNAVKVKFEGRIDIRLGAEIGGPHDDPDEAKRIYNKDMFDFVIGSIHNLRYTKDFYYFDYPDDLSTLRPYIEQYYTEYLEIASSGCCDVLGHLGYMQRYAARQDKYYDFSIFTDMLREVYKAAISKGIGIEVNTSAVHEKYGKIIPDKRELELYRDCGGEIITVGSDAHKAEFVGYAIEDTYELLREIGFKYVTIFRSHKPEYIKL